VEPITVTTDTLSTTKTQEGGNGYASQRALTVRNNVAVDVTACSSTLLPDVAVNIAHQIAPRFPPPKFTTRTGTRVVTTSPASTPRKPETTQSEHAHQPRWPVRTIA
jgi:PknH-like extracellular domain